MYSLTGYGDMLRDTVRSDAYAQAMRRFVRPGSVVVEIGTGPGAFAVFACQLGARRVYAIEPDSVIQVARELAAANRCADRIEFIEDLSTNVTLPEQADVIVSDLRGLLPLFQSHLPSIADARRRFLAPGGTLIPKRDTLYAAVVSSPDQYAQIVEGWEKNGLGVNLAPARQMGINDITKFRCTAEQLLSQSQLWATLDYSTIDYSDVRSTLNFSIQRPAIGHGIVVWFDACLADGIGFSNAPGAPARIYGSMFLPWAEPVSLVEGQNVSVDLQANFVEKDYVWRWKTRIDPVDGSGKRICFDQSQLTGAVFSPSKLRRTASDYIPQLSPDGLVDRRALELMDGVNSLEEIARRLCDEFPQRFPHWSKALGFAARQSQEHSQ
jgi:protein arginine N-methyltransferase 1